MGTKQTNNVRGNRSKAREGGRERESAREVAQRPDVGCSPQTLQGGCDGDRMNLSGCSSKESASGMPLPGGITTRAVYFGQVGGVNDHFVDA